MLELSIRIFTYSRPNHSIKSLFSHNVPSTLPPICSSISAAFAFGTSASTGLPDTNRVMRAGQALARKAERADLSSLEDLLVRHTSTQSYFPFVNSRRTTIIQGVRDSLYARASWQGYRIWLTERTGGSAIYCQGYRNASSSASHLSLSELLYSLIPVAKAEPRPSRCVSRTPSPRAPWRATFNTGIRPNAIYIDTWTATPLEDMVNLRQHSSGGGERVIAQEPIRMACPRSQEGIRLRSQKFKSIFQPP